MADLIRETNWCNPDWRHIERRSGANHEYVTGHAYINKQSGVIKIEKERFWGLWISRKTIKVDPALAASIAAQELAS